MEKKLQQELICWLKQHSLVSRSWLSISILLGVINGIIIIVKAWLIAYILHCLIIERMLQETLLLSFIILAILLIVHFWVTLQRERIGFYAGQCVRHEIRRQVLDYLQQSGPIWIQEKPSGSWAMLIVEQIDNMHDYYANYLPQISLAIYVPLMIAITIFPINWIVVVILFSTAPLIPLFMIMIGMKATDANQRNFQALSRLGGYFLDRLRGMDTLRIFWRKEIETKNICQASQDFRIHTMEVLRLAFISSGVLEFFSSLSIALIAVYFSFSYLGKLNFGHYNSTITLLTGFMTLILAPEFFRPLRDLGAFYHAKAQAISVADNLKKLLEVPSFHKKHNGIVLDTNELVTLKAKELCILSPEGKILTGPLNFSIYAGQRVALVGVSGSGKSSLINTLLGFLPYTGSLQINGIELCKLNLAIWRKMLSWIGQNPQLPAATLRDNILLANPKIDKNMLNLMLDKTYISKFLPLLSHGIDTAIGNNCAGLSVGQAQCVAIARALLNPCRLLLLDEPTASLDKYSKQHVMKMLNSVSKAQSTLMATHQLYDIITWDNILVIDNGRIVEQGDYATLCAQQGIFTKLFVN